MCLLVTDGRVKLAQDAVLASEAPMPPVVEECVKAGRGGSGGLGGAGVISNEVDLVVVAAAPAGAETAEAASGDMSGLWPEGIVTGGR